MAYRRGPKCGGGAKQTYLLYWHHILNNGQLQHTAPLLLRLILRHDLGLCRPAHWLHAWLKSHKWREKIHKRPEFHNCKSLHVNVVWACLCAYDSTFMCSVLAAEWIIITTGTSPINQCLQFYSGWISFCLSAYEAESFLTLSPSITRRWSRSNWVLWSSTRGTWWRGREVQGSGSIAVIAWGHITGELTPRPFLVGVASAGEDSDVTPRQLRALQCCQRPRWLSRGHDEQSRSLLCQCSGKTAKSSSSDVEINVIWTV